MWDKKKGETIQEEKRKTQDYHTSLVEKSFSGLVFMRLVAHPVTLSKEHNYWQPNNKKLKHLSLEIFNHSRQPKEPAVVVNGLHWIMV